jgi:hypothetical protein
MTGHFRHGRHRVALVHSAYVRTGNGAAFEATTVQCRCGYAPMIPDDLIERMPAVKRGPRGRRAA